MFMLGVDKIVEAFVKLRVGEVGRESEHCLGSGSNGVGDGLVSVTRIPCS